MEYRSPIRLVAHADEPIDSFSLQVMNRARKKLLAEMALQGDQLLLENISYTKNDVISLLNGITSEELWKFHCMIYSYPALLNFLEEGVFDTEEFKNVHYLLLPGNEVFTAFVSPYFALSFNEQAGALIGINDFATLSDLMDYQALILPEHAHEGFQKIRIYLDELMHLLKNLSWEKFQRDESILHFLFSEDWISFMNKLPDTFAHVRDELVIQILNVVFRFQKKATWYYLYKACESLKQMECGDFQKSEINRFEEAMARNANIAGRGGKASTGKGLPAGRMIFWVLWIVLAIVRAGGGCDHDSSSFVPSSFNVTYSNASAPVNVKGFRQYLNTLSNNDTLKADPQPLKTGDLPFNAFSQLPLSTWPDTLYIENKTGYDCAVLYFQDPKDGVYPRNGLMPAMFSVYVGKNSNYLMKLFPYKGTFSFIFGEQWGQLKKTQQFILNKGDLSNESLQGSNTDLYLYNWFINKKPLPQYYLQHDIMVVNPENSIDTTAYKSLNVLKQDARQFGRATRLVITHQNNQFIMKASGRLQVLEAKANNY